MTAPYVVVVCARRAAEAAGVPDRLACALPGMRRPLRRYQVDGKSWGGARRVLAAELHDIGWSFGQIAEVLDETEAWARESCAIHAGRFVAAVERCSGLDS